MSVKIEGLKALQKKIDNISIEAEKFTLQAFKTFAINVERDAKRFAPVDEGKLRQAIKGEVKINGKTIECIISVNVDYAAYVEFGTKKFAAKYVSQLPSDWQTFAKQFKGKGRGSVEDLIKSIMVWVKRKGIGANTTKSGAVSKSKSSIEAQENAAYIITLRILQNGIKPHPYLYPAYEKNIPEVRKKLQQQGK